MENIYRLGDDRYMVIQDTFDGYKASYFKADGMSVDNDLDSRWYKTEDNAIRQAERRFGHKAELFGESADGGAWAYINAALCEHLVGVWRVSSCIIHEPAVYAGDPDVKTVKMAEYRDEDEAWDAYEAISFRGIKCYEASKHLYLTRKFSDYQIREVTVACEEYRGRCLA